MVTIKRIDTVSAMKVGAFVYAMLFTIFGLLWLGLQGLMLNALTSIINSSGGFTMNGQATTVPNNAFAVAGLAGCLFIYVFGVIASAISGGIFGLVTAFCYNLTANWFGGLRVSLDTVPTPDKLKRDVVVDQPL